MHFITDHKIGIGDVVLHKASSQDDHACAFGKHGFTIQPPDIYITKSTRNSLKILQYVPTGNIFGTRHFIFEQKTVSAVWMAKTYETQLFDVCFQAQLKTDFWTDFHASVK